MDKFLEIFYKKIFEKFLRESLKKFQEKCLEGPFYESVGKLKQLILEESLEKFLVKFWKNSRGNSRRNSWRNFGKISELCRGEIYEGIIEIPEGGFEKISELLSSKICLEKIQLMDEFLKEFCTKMPREIAGWNPGGVPLGFLGRISELSDGKISLKKFFWIRAF